MLCPAAAHTQFVAKRLIQPTLQRTLGLIFPAGREPTAAARVLADVIRSTVLSENLETPRGVKKIIR